MVGGCFSASRHFSELVAKCIFIFLGQFISMVKISAENCIDYLVNYVEEMAGIE